MKQSNQQEQTTQGADAESNKLDLRNEIQEKYGRQAVPWFSWVFDALELPYGSRVLELGCGTGKLWQENKEHIPRGWQMVLSDRDPDMLRSAAANLARLRRDIHFIQSDSQTIPFPAERFDAVLAVGLLDLVPDLEQALGEVWRVLRPSGMFLATAGGKGHLQEMEALLRPFLPASTAEVLGGIEERFGLENGEHLLAPFFEEIVRSEYSDRMVFTQLQPILNYMFSEQAVRWSMQLNNLGSLVHKIKHDLAQKGSISVNVRKGMFIARKKIVV